MNQETIGDRIKRIREHKGLSQEDLARSCQMTVSYISSLERNLEKYNNPTLGSIHAIAEALEVHPTVILYGTSLTYKSSATKEFIDPNNPLDVTAFMKSIEELLPLSPKERDLIMDYRSVSDKTERQTIERITKSYSNRK
jgi:transcriptional regulator with XRE-family HTH domain